MTPAAARAPRRSSAMRSAAPVGSPPWSGCAQAHAAGGTARCTSVAIERPCSAPQPEHLHRPPPLGRDARSTRRRRGRRRRAAAAAGPAAAGARPGHALEQPPDDQPLRQRAGLRERGVDRRAAPCGARRRRQRRRRHHRADHLRRRAGRGGRARGRREPVARSTMRCRDRSRPWVSVWSRYRSAIRGTRQARRGRRRAAGAASSRCSSSSPSTNSATTAPSSTAPYAAPLVGQVGVAERDPPRRHVPAGVADVQLGEDHATALDARGAPGRYRAGRRWPGRTPSVFTSVAPSIRRAKS